MKTVKRVIAIVVLAFCLLFFGYISHTCKTVKNNKTATAKTVAA